LHYTIKSTSFSELQKPGQTSGLLRWPGQNRPSDPKTRFQHWVTACALSTQPCSVWCCLVTCFVLLS